MKAYGIGTLAYLDTFSGLVPCKVVGIGEDHVHIVLTAGRGAYRRGEHLRERGMNVIPRNHVYVRDHQYRIRNGFEWSDD